MPPNLRSSLHRVSIARRRIFYTLIFEIFRSRSTYRRLRVAIQFPSDYPDARLNVELKSKTVPPKVLEKLTRLCDEELKQWIGKEQVCKEAM